MEPLLMLSVAYCDQIAKHLYIKITSYCYHSVNEIKYDLTQGDHNKRCPQYIKTTKRVTNINYQNQHYRTLKNNSLKHSKAIF